MFPVIFFLPGRESTDSKDDCAETTPEISAITSSSSLSSKAPRGKLQNPVVASNPAVHLTNSVVKAGQISLHLRRTKQSLDESDQRTISYLSQADATRKLRNKE